MGEEWEWVIVDGLPRVRCHMSIQITKVGAEDAPKETEPFMLTVKPDIVLLEHCGMLEWGAYTSAQSPNQRVPWSL